MSPPRDSSAAVRRPAIPEDDPVWQSFLRAPVVYDEHEQLTEEQRAEEAAAMAAGTAGSVSHNELVGMIRTMAEEAGELEDYEEFMRTRQAR